jgi:hypothetical protein
MVDSASFIADCRHFTQMRRGPSCLPEVDERSRQIGGADSIEMANWWSGVGRWCDGDPPGPPCARGCTCAAGSCGLTGNSAGHDIGLTTAPS